MATTAKKPPVKASAKAAAVKKPVKKAEPMTTQAMRSKLRTSAAPAPAPASAGHAPLPWDDEPKAAAPAPAPLQQVETKAAPVSSMDTVHQTLAVLRNLGIAHDNAVQAATSPAPDTAPQPAVPTPAQAPVPVPPPSKPVSLADHPLFSKTVQQAPLSTTPSITPKVGAPAFAYATNSSSFGTVFAGGSLEKPKEEPKPASKAFWATSSSPL